MSCVCVLCVERGKAYHIQTVFSSSSSSSLDDDDDDDDSSFSDDDDMFLIPNHFQVLESLRD